MRCASLLETVTEKSATPVLLAAIKGRRTMKYICLGYYDKSKHDAMTEAEKQAMFDACFNYDDHLRANGHWVGGQVRDCLEMSGRPSSLESEVVAMPSKTLCSENSG